MTQTLQEKKIYWQKRMIDKIGQALRSIDWIYDEMMNTSKHAGIPQNRIKKALEMISQGFRSLFDAVNEITPTTPEGVLDLGKINEKEN